MAPTLEPEAEISPLPNPDGSVAFSYAGYKVIASANGPIETVKRDEYAFEAQVDVVVRPPAGVGGKNPLTGLVSASLVRVSSMFRRLTWMDMQARENAILSRFFSQPSARSSLLGTSRGVSSRSPSRSRGCLKMSTRTARSPSTTS